MIEKQKSKISSENQKIKFNTFLAVLRVYLCFNVINSHFLRTPPIIMKKNVKRIIANSLHVPIFFLMSFYFSHKLFLQKNVEKIKKRFERLLIPYFIWPMIIWIINNFLYYAFGLLFNISLKGLIIQLMTGNCFMKVLWFQYNLIFATLLIIIIIFLSLNYSIPILLNLCIFAFYFQYSNLNYKIFSKYDFFRRYTFGRFSEIIPYCIIGFIIPSLNLIVLRKYKIYSIYLLLLIFLFLLRYEIFIKINGFMYQGIPLVIKSSLVFLIFLLMPYEKINNKYISIIKIVTSYTSGIYFLNSNVQKWMKNCITLIKNGTLSGNIIIYIISYVISLIGEKIVRKSKYRCLFQ
jgi:fucose 4-O-acetylase-like acetyltransferase